MTSKYHNRYAEFRARLVRYIPPTRPCCQYKTSRGDCTEMAVYLDHMGQRMCRSHADFYIKRWVENEANTPTDDTVISTIVGKAWPAPKVDRKPYWNNVRSKFRYIYNEFVHPAPFITEAEGDSLTCGMVRGVLRGKSVSQILSIPNVGMKTWVKISTLLYGRVYVRGEWLP